MSSSLPTDEWKTILPELLRILRPNGFLELFDTAGEYENPGNWQTSFWQPCMRRFRATMGMTPEAYSAFVPWFTEAGFVNAQQLDVLQPIGPWAGKLGMVGFDMYKRILTHLKTRFLTSGTIPSPQEAEEAFQGRLEEITRGQEAIVWNVYIARKPSYKC
jgi:hypothetical protein